MGRPARVRLPFDAFEVYLKNRVGLIPDWTVNNTTRITTTAASIFPMWQLETATHIDRRMLYRWIEAGCTLDAADRMCEALDIYPTAVWGHAYLDAIDEQERHEADPRRAA